MAAWAALRNGIWEAEPQWVRLAVADTLKWFGAFLAVALALVFLGALGGR